MTEEMLARLLRSRNGFVTRYQQAHPGTDQSDALTAAFSAGVTAALNLPADDTTVVGQSSAKPSVAQTPGPSSVAG